MTLHEVSGDYQATVGAMHDLWRTNEGKEPGDPARAARVLIHIVNHPQPPLRLLLGAGAVAAAERASDARAPKPRPGQRSAARPTSQDSKLTTDDVRVRDVVEVGPVPDRSVMAPAVTLRPAERQRRV